MNSKLIAKLKRSLRKGGVVKPAVTSMATYGGLGGALAYYRASKAKNNGADKVNPVRSGALGAAAGAILGAAMTPSAFQLLKAKKIVKHPFDRYGESYAHSKSASVQPIKHSLEKTLQHVAKTTLGGALVGGTVASSPGAKYDKKSKTYQNSPVTPSRIAKGALVGALGGVYVGANSLAVDHQVEKALDALKRRRRETFGEGKRWGQP